MVNFVEAIEEGRIVKVTEDYARREGLLIVRKQSDSTEGNVSSNLSGFRQELVVGGLGSGISGVPDRGRMSRRDFKMETLRKPLHYYKNEVVADLVDNFHWQISSVRKAKNMTRRQLAQKVGENEETIKMVENGILPQDNYILINKIQSTLGINLRKEGKKFEVPKLSRTLSAAANPRWVRQGERPFISGSKDEVEIVDADAGEKLGGEEVEIFDEDSEERAD